MQENEVLDYIKQAFELKNQGCYKQAIEMLYKTLETEIDNAEILYQLGELYFQLHNYPRAEKYIEKVLQKLPSHIESYKLLKEIYLRQNDIQNAKTVAEKIYTLDGASKNLAELIKILSLLEEYDEIEKYMASNQQSSDVLLEYAQSLYARGNSDRALEILNSLDSDIDSAQILKGKILFLESLSGNEARIFSYLNQLAQIKDFNRISGIIFGTFTELEGNNSITATQEYQKEVKKNLGLSICKKNIPLVFTGDIGHGNNSKALILGENLTLRKKD